MRHLLLIPLCAALLGPGRAPARDAPELLVDALGCEVPVSTRYHAEPGRDGITFGIPGTLGTRIWVGPLSAHAGKPLDSKYAGALKVERFAPGCFALSDRPWTSVQGLHQEVDLIGLSEAEVAHVIEHCNATMNPEAAAVAARMARGCAAVLPTQAAKDALFGKAGLTSEVTPREGTTRPFPVTSWAIFLVERSPALAAQGVSKGARVTSVCGVPVSEIEEGGASLCCARPVTDSLEAVIVQDGKARTITAPAPAHSAPGAEVAGLVPQRSSIGCGSAGSL